MNNDELRCAFEACSLDPKLFDHRSHMRLAWLYLQDLSLSHAIECFTTNLRRYTRYVGAAAKYNETISWFYMLAIAERQKKHPCTNFDDFLASNPELTAPGAPLLKRSYRPETLASELAREIFLLPDAHNGTCPKLSD